ncbi:alginate export family protein [Pedosphaera parvula]|uniref:Alginate export domain-containing protein n=1 Tax=Pedosphaera parvula (strain Ellin514) TaxID=320771 RepID=B9XJ69_PEDPL|nr:alginate export family protein [Pedosphaera parvula]EEF60107.1 conserved hypothetical protein [Pedosphaera parvula Ellin514]
MKRTCPTLLTSSLVLGLANQVYAQYTPPPPPQPFQGFINEYLRKDDPYMNKWDFGGAMRLRYEDHEGYGIPGRPGTPPALNNDFRAHGADVDNDYFLSRIRLHVGYVDEWWSAYVEGQSSLTYNDQRFAYANVPPVAGTVKKQGDGPEYDAINLHQAFATIGNHKEFPLSLKVGRQELSYGEERLVGAYGWNNIGRVFDAAKLRWQNEWFGADFFTGRVVIPENGRFDVSNDYDWFSGVYATSPMVPKNILDVYFLSRNASPQAAAAEPSPQFPQPSARDIYTIGSRLKSRPGELAGWDYSLEGAYQFGNFRDSRAGAPKQRLDQQAYMVVLQGGYTFTNLWATPRLGLEYDFASGDSNPHDGKHETFDNLFPTNHRFYGSLDFVSLQNIHDVGAILQLKPLPSVSVALQGNALWLADTHDSFYNVGGVARGGTTSTPGTGFGVNPDYSNFLGTELTAIVGWAPTRFAQLEGGYGHFFHGQYISQTWSAPGFGARDADFCYVQLTMLF